MPGAGTAILIIILFLAIIFIWLYFDRKIKALIKKTDGASSRKEERLYKLYQNIEEMLDAFEEFVEESAEKIRRERKELTELSQRAAVTYAYVCSLERGLDGAKPAEPSGKDGAAPPCPPPEENVSAAPARRARGTAPGGGAVTAPKAVKPGKAEEEKSAPEAPVLSGAERRELSKMSTKAQKVRHLITKGLSPEAIARELGIGKGEVRLIMSLRERP